MSLGQFLDEFKGSRWGVPTRALAKQFRVISSDLKDCDLPEYFDKGTSIYAADQIKLYNQELEHGMPSAIAVYSGQRFPDDSRLAVGKYLYGMYRYGDITNPAHDVKWVRLNSSYKNDFLEEFNESRLSVPKVLVIDNLYFESSMSRLDKARDLIEFVPAENIFVIAAGGCPLNFAYSKLNVEATRFLYFR